MEDTDDPGTFLFMNSFQVGTNLENTEQLEAFISYTFTGGVDYQYTIKYVYGEPGGDNVVMVNNPLEPEAEETSSAAFKRRKTQ